MIRRATIRRGLAIFTVAASVGLMVNVLSPRGLPLKGPVPSWVQDLDQINLAEAAELYQKRAAVFVDARSEEEYRLGHIPGAILLSQEVDESISAFKGLFPLDTLMVAYCSGAECGSSAEAAERLKEAGYVNVKVLPGGWEEWLASGQPVQGNALGDADSTSDQPG